MHPIYISHSTNFDYIRELYSPLKLLRGFSLILPHEKPGILKSSKETIQTCSAVIAEVSIPSHGVGIELGWADAFRVPIIFIFKRNSRISSSLKFLSSDFLEYDKVEDILPELKVRLVDILDNHRKRI